LFRSSLNLLSNALNRTKQGVVHLKIFPIDNASKMVFQCEDTGPDIDVNDYPSLFKPSRCGDGDMRLGLSSTALLISSIDGEYGFRPRAASGLFAACSEAKGKGSIFWFSVPIYIPENFGVSPDGGPVTVVPRQTRGHLRVDHNTFNKISPILPMIEPRAPSMSNLMDLAVTEQMQNSMDLSERGVNAFSQLMENSGAGRIRRALVVDDSLVVRKSIASALTKLGYKVTQAMNGLEGLNSLKDTLFDLCFLDFLMPVMDGLDCVNQYRTWERKYRPTFRQLIIGISAHASANDGGKGLTAGMDDFKAKPLSIKTLAEIHESKLVGDKARELDDLANLTISDNHNYSSNNIKNNNSSKSIEMNSFKPILATSNPTEKPQKRIRRSNALGAANGPSDNVCLLASKFVAGATTETLTHLETSGWRVVVVEDRKDALRLLQSRNWDAVFIDEELPTTSGMECIRDFRTWEEQKRVNKQKHIFLLSENDIPAPYDELAIVQPPTGFDGVLKRPIRWDELNFIIQQMKNDCMEIIIPA
jgi:CheY-like chemotaxis protein